MDRIEIHCLVSSIREAQDSNAHVIELRNLTALPTKQGESFGGPVAALARDEYGDETACKVAISNLRELAEVGDLYGRPVRVIMEMLPHIAIS